MAEPRGRHPWIWFVHLAAPEEVLRRRIEGRSGHDMPASMLDSQLDTLEPLETDEPGTTVQALGTPSEIADRLMESLRLGA